MGMDLSVYLKEALPVSRGDLVNALHARGWYALVVDSARLSPLPPGAVIDDTILAARNSKTCEAFRNALAASQAERLEALAEENELGSFRLSLSSEFDARQEIGGKELKRLEKLAGKAFVDRLRACHFEYHLSFKPGSYVANEAWQILGALTDGILHDPQSSEWCIQENGELRNCVEAPADANPFRDFFLAAHAQGVPFDPLGGDPLGDMRSDKLDPPALEALLELAQKMVSSDMYSVLADMTIADYTAKKGPNFVRKNTEWIEALKKRFGSGR